MRRVLPGLPLSLGYTVAYLSALVLIPLAACVLKAASLSLEEFWAAVWTPDARAAYALTFGASLAAALVNVALGLVVAWSLVRYDFPGKRLVDSLVDLPFALPTAVAGLVYASLYGPHGWVGQFLAPAGIEVAYTRLGIVVVLIFTGFPFVVRTVQPVLQELDGEVEEASHILGASRWQTFTRVLFPAMRPALVTGFTLAFARAVGEYGSVIFIAGNRSGVTEIAPVLIVARLESFAYAEAAAIAVVLLTVSLALLAGISLLQRWSRVHDG
jgi:sulfate transport system permease protein